MKLDDPPRERFWSGRNCAKIRTIVLIEPSNTIMSHFHESNWKTRLVRGEFPDRTFDIEFWQAQGDEAIFAAAWEMVELAEEIKNGGKPTLQRTATVLKRI